MRVVNIHERHYAAAPERAGELLDGLAGGDDRVWPGESWPPMRFDRPLGVGARGGHGPIRYTVVAYEPARRVRFRFDGPTGFDGHHEFRVEDAPGGGSTLVHELRMTARGAARATWPLAFRPLHDALVEDALTKAQTALGEAPEPRPWSFRVKALRRVLQLVLPKRRPETSKRRGADELV